MKRTRTSLRHAAANGESRGVCARVEKEREHARGREREREGEGEGQRDRDIERQRDRVSKRRE